MSAVAELVRVIDHLHGCKAVHLRSEPVHEVFQGQTVWSGQVEIFALSGHPKAKHCYAWKHWEDASGQHERIVTVLELPPVNSAVAAVRASVVADVKRNRAN